MHIAAEQALPVPQALVRPARQHASAEVSAESTSPAPGSDRPALERTRSAGSQRCRSAVGYRASRRRPAPPIAGLVLISYTRSRPSTTRSRCALFDVRGRERIADLIRVRIFSNVLTLLLPGPIVQDA